MSRVRIAAIALWILILLPALAPGSAQAALTFYTDRPTFDAAFPGLPTEDFEEGNVSPGSVVGCPGPLDETNNDSCFSPGDILPGIRFNSSAPQGGIELALSGAGFSGATSSNVVANFFVDSFDIFFPDDDVFAAGMDLVGFFGADTVQITIYGAGGVVIGSTTAASTPAGSFWGVAADEVITRINIYSPTNQAEGVDNISFGGWTWYFSTSTIRFVPTGAGVMQLFPQNVYDGSLQSLGGSFLPYGVNLDAVDRLSDTELLFSVRPGGPVVQTGGVLFLNESAVYRLDLTSGTIVPDPIWASLGIQTRTLDAIDNLGSDGFAFSVNQSAYVWHAGGADYLRPWNVYRVSLGGTIDSTPILDGAALALADVDAVDVLPGGRIAFSTAADSFAVRPGRPLWIRSGIVYIYDPGDGSVSEFFDGGAAGWGNLDGFTTSASD